MIQQIQIQNYKALGDVKVALTPLHVLIGPNDSGKTSILEALSAICRSTDFELSQAFSGAWQGQELVNSVTAVYHPVITISVLTGGVGYHLSTRFLADDRSRNVVIEGEHIFQGAKEFDLTLKNSSVSGVYELRRIRPGDNLELRQAAEMVHSALSGVHFYRWDARMLALPAAPDSARRFRMGPSGFGLALCLDDILGYDRNAFTAIEDRFRAIFPEFGSIKLLPQPAYRAPMEINRSVPMLLESEGKGIFFQLTKGGLIPASQASEGAMLVLAYLAVLGLPDPPNVLLVEEPENGIHPKRLQQVMRILRDVVARQARTQVVVTTHSPYLLDLLTPEEVTLCRRDKTGAIAVHRLSNMRSVRDQLDVFTLGEIWTAEGDEKLAASAGGEAGK